MKNKRKRKKNNHKKIIITIIIAVIIVLITLFVSYKTFILNKYDVSKLNLDNYDKFLEGYKNQTELTIDNVSLTESEYLTYLNIKVKNILGNSVEEDYTNNLTQTVIYKKKDETGNVIDSMSITIMDNYKEIFSSDEKQFITSINSEGESTPLEADIDDYLEENNIKNDQDLFKFLSETRDYVPNIFTSTKKIKEHYGLHLVASITMPKIDSITFLSGEYQGYIFNINNYKQIAIEKNNEQYVVLLKDKTDEEILQFLNSIVILDKEN